MDFLPICKQDMLARGWEQCDFVYVIGDAYVDHPSFGHAIISRVLEMPAILSGSSLNRTGRILSLLISMAVPVLASLSPAAIWIPW